MKTNHLQEVVGSSSPLSASGISHSETYARPSFWTRIKRFFSQTTNITRRKSSDSDAAAPLTSSSDDWMQIPANQKLIAEFMKSQEAARDSSEQQVEAPKRKTRAKKTSAIPLFYNPREEAELNAIITAFQPGNFTAIQKRLTQCGCTKGFACLFYGTPGTGKTATAYRFAELTGREIIRVEIPGLRSRYVGESERNFHQVFTDYNKAIAAAKKVDKPVPILLFNEADAIFSRRVTDVRESADQLLNSLQNILLQELEDFKGILIATTNLTTNLDSAFDRRFIYKVRFDNPGSEVASRIWRSRLTYLTDAEADSLASDFQFSGGQIDNIVRKQVIQYVLTGRNPDINELRAFCRQEIIDRKNQNRPVISF